MPTGDLTTLADVKTRAGVDNPSDDQEIQDAISGFSEHIVGWTGRGADLYSVALFNETRDGNGNDRMFTRYRPIANVSALSINGVAIPQAGAWPTAGYYVGDDKKQIRIRPGLSRLSAAFGMGSYSMLRSQLSQSRGFDVGVGNVAISYYAGHATVPYSLEYAVRCIVAINYKRKGWQDQASRTTSIQGGSATTRFRDWEWPPEFQCMLEEFRRHGFIG